jgi:hypothetical protein
VMLVGGVKLDGTRVRSCGSPLHIQHEMPMDRGLGNERAMAEATAHNFHLRPRLLGMPLR